MIASFLLWRSLSTEPHLGDFGETASCPPLRNGAIANNLRHVGSPPPTEHQILHGLHLVDVLLRIPGWQGAEARAFVGFRIRVYVAVRPRRVMERTTVALSD